MAHLRTCCRILPFVIFLAAIAASARAADLRIAVRPVEAYNAADLESALAGLQSAAASRFAGPGLHVTILKSGEAAVGDWAIRLTLTKMGSGVNIDGAAEPVRGGAEILRTYEVAESADHLFSALTTVVTSLRKAIVASTPMLAVAAPAATAPSPSPVASLSAPVPPQAPSALLSATPTAQSTEISPLGRALARYRIGEPVAGQALSLAVADADGDGVNELLALTENEILAFRDDGREIRLRWRAQAGENVRPSVISVGDVDQDGLPEVFVAGLRSGSPVTEVYQWTAGNLAPRKGVVSAFLRAITHPERGLLLLGMTTSEGGKGFFDPEIHSYVWTKGMYKDQGALAAAPQGLVTDFDWYRFKENERPWLVQTTQEGKLQVFDENGKVLVRGAEEVKGSENTLQSSDQLRLYRLEDNTFSVLQGKTLLWRDASGTAHLILQKNIAFTTVLRRVRSYSESQLVSFHLEGLGLTTSGQSPIIPGYLADIGLGPNPLRPSATTVYGLLNQTEGLVLKDRSIRVLAWDL